MHEKHRERLRQTYREVGIKGMHEHQILELLLTYAIPVKDTNGTAHRLIDRFGCLENVLHADVYELMKQDGVGEVTAILLHLVGRIGASMRNSRPRGNQINTPDDAVKYCRSVIGITNKETMYVISMDRTRRVLHCDQISTGTPSETTVYPRLVVECAVRHDAENIILCHNHPSGNVKPSKEDYLATKSILAALEPIGIMLHDHIIIGGDNAYSMTRNAVLEGGESGEVRAVAAESEGS